MVVLELIVELQVAGGGVTVGCLALWLLVLMVQRRFVWVLVWRVGGTVIWKIDGRCSMAVRIWGIVEVLRK